MSKNFSWSIGGVICLFFTVVNSLQAEPPKEGRKIQNAQIVEIDGDRDDPFADPSEGTGREIAEENTELKTGTSLLRLEVFELPLMDSLLLMDGLEPGGGDESMIRRKVLELVKQEKASVIELKTLRLEIGTSAREENTVERIYPTEYEPPESIPVDSELNKPDAELNPTQRSMKAAMRFACPTTFDTRKAGVFLNAEVLVVASDPELWDVNLNYSRTMHLKETSWVEGTITMPLFQTESWNSFVRVKNGKWNLLSTQTGIDENGQSDRKTTKWYFLKVEQVR